MVVGFGTDGVGSVVSTPIPIGTPSHDKEDQDDSPGYCAHKMGGGKHRGWYKSVAFANVYSNRRCVVKREREEMVITYPVGTRGTPS